MESKSFQLLIILYIALELVAFQLSPKKLNAEQADLQKNNDQCIICHLGIEMMPADFNKEDVHLKAGLSCAECHGGDPKAEDMEESMSPKKGFIGIPSRLKTPQLCGTCHSNINYMRTFQPRIATDQVQQYFTSIHGKKLRQGDKKAAECVSCHSAHKIFSAKDARSTVYPLNLPETCKKCHSNIQYMKEYNIPIDQHLKYANSIHGKNLLEKGDLGSPVCNDCHGNHGANPPGLESVSHVCGACHVNNMDYFLSSPMAEIFQESGIHACEQCHGYHDVNVTNDEMLGTSESSVCMSCHSAGDTGYESSKEMYTYITDFVEEYNSAEKKLREVQQKGMDDVDILFQLQEAKQILIHSRTLVHNFNTEEIKKNSEEGKAKARVAVETAEKEIKDYHTRRRGFGIATLFIMVLTIALFFKIRGMD
jgi:predicted CXXCH cytochrome family protein